MNKPKDHWIMNDSIFIHYDGGWGLDRQLKTAYLGKEEDILKAFAEGKSVEQYLQEQLAGKAVELSHSALQRNSRAIKD